MTPHFFELHIIFERFYDGGDEFVANEEGDADDGGNDLEPVVDRVVHYPFVDGVEDLGAAEIDYDALHGMDLAEIILEGVFAVGMVGMEAHIGSEWQPTYAEACLETGAGVEESETGIKEEAELGNSYAECKGCQIVANLMKG